MDHWLGLSVSHRTQKMSQGTHNGHTVNVFMCNASQTSVMHTQQVSDFIGESRTTVRRQEVAKIGGGSFCIYF